MAKIPERKEPAPRRDPPSDACGGGKGDRAAKNEVADHGAPKHKKHRGVTHKKGAGKAHTTAAERKIYQAQNRLKRWAGIAKAAKDKEMAEFLGVDLQMETVAEHRRREAYQKKRWRREWEQDAENKPAPVPAKEAEDADMGEEEEEAPLNPPKK